MKLEHIAISISEPEESKNFYKNILGMREIKAFTLKKSLANDIFSLDEEASVFLLQKDILSLEIFGKQEINRQSFNHICLQFMTEKHFFIKLNKKLMNVSG